jgi:hypothetical protein
MVKSIDWGLSGMMLRSWHGLGHRLAHSKNKVRVRTLFLAPKGLFSGDHEPRRRRLCRARIGLVTINTQATRLRDTRTDRPT